MVNLETNWVACGNRSERVKAKLAEFLYILDESYPELIELDQLASGLWGTVRPIGWQHVLTVYASQGRRIGNRLGFEIRNKYNIGYRLEFTGVPT